MPMTNDRFEELIDSFIGGQPVTLIVPRLLLLIRTLIDLPGVAERFEFFVLADAEAQAKRADGDPPMPPIETGQPFPEGIKLHAGSCEQCGRKGKQAWMRLKVGVGTSPDKEVCAECLADFIMAPFGEVYALTAQNKWQRLAGEMRR